MEQQMCKDCVNWIYCDDSTYPFCDFDYWEETPEDDAILFCAEIFGCQHFEDINKL